MITVYGIQLNFKGGNFEAAVRKNGDDEWPFAFVCTEDDEALAKALNHIANQDTAEKIISVGTIMEGTLNQRVRVITIS